MASPSLVIRRVVVEGEFSCDINFERGLNIIQAVESSKGQQFTNKCGKTTLVELIRYGMGRRIESFKRFFLSPLHNKIQTLWLEIETNGEVLTIERSLNEIYSSMRIRNGGYVSGIENTQSESVKVEDMSPLMLKLLSIPSVAVKQADGKLDQLSFPLLMRAFILHQEDSFGAILDKVQPEERRKDIIGFLTQITPLERYTVDERLAAVQTKAQELQTYYDSVHSFLSESGVPSLSEAVENEIAAREALEQAKIGRRNLQREIQGRTAQLDPAKMSGKVDKLRKDLLEVKDHLGKTEMMIVGFQQEEVRLKEIAASLRTDKQKAQRLLTSTTILSSIEFSICPRCLLGITPEMKLREQHLRCSLCNRNLRTTSDSPPRAVPKTEDIDLQIQEAESVLADTREKRESLEVQLEELKKTEVSLSHELQAESESYVSPIVDHLINQADELALLESRLAEAKNILEQAKALDKISADLDDLHVKQAELEDLRREASKPNKVRVNRLRHIYSSILKAVDFPSFRSCSIDPISLMPNINNQLYVHSGTALKGLATVCYHLAFLGLSNETSTFLPKMLVIDSPAVGDLNIDNQEKFLRFIARIQSQSRFRCDDGTPDWQIILTTRRMVPELEEFVREKLSAPDHMLLRKKKRKYLREKP